MGLDADLAGEILFESQDIINNHLINGRLEEAEDYVSDLKERLQAQQLDCIGEIYNHFIKRVHDFY